MVDQHGSTLDHVVLEEYKALRAEILACLEKRVGIISLGLTAIGALVAGGMAPLARDHPNWLASAIIIGVGVPVTSLYVLDVWFSEWKRLIRASYHNWYLELKMQQLFPGAMPPLEWEQRVRSTEKPYRQLKTPYETTTVMFVGIALVSGLAGLFLFLKAAEEIRILGVRQLWCWWSLLALVLLAAACWHGYRRMKQTRELATDYSVKPIVNS